MYTNTGTFVLYMYILIHAYMYATESKVLGLDQIGVFQTTEPSLYARPYYVCQYYVYGTVHATYRLPTYSYCCTVRYITAYTVLRSCTVHEYVRSITTSTCTVPLRTQLATAGPDST